MDVSYKQFDKNLCQENDKIAKDLALNFLLYTKKFVCQEAIDEQKEMYKAWDFILYDVTTKEPVHFEVERKKVWTKSGRWQGWPTLDVPTRKNKSKADYFVMINGPCDTLAITTMDIVINSSVSSKQTIYTSAEGFFNVKLDQMKFYYCSDNKWQRVKP